ncbi:MAG: AEC family transporter [Selenomonadaceae bacterium]|nr:AEC family transporter [Selenomonadaceae bacterium]
MMVLQQMLIFLCLMLLGVWAREKGMLTEDNQKQISALVVNIAYPAIILSGVSGNGAHMEGAELVFAFGVAIVVLAAAVALGKITPYILGYEKKYHGIINVMVVFTNIGFMGMPMIHGIYGADALIYMTVFLIPFNVLFYSYAIQTMQPAGNDKKKFRLSDLVNVGMGACVLSVIIYFSGIRLPYVLNTTIQMVGGLTAPLAMMLIGASLPDIPWKSVLTNGRLICFVMLKMLVFPTAVLLTLGQFVENQILLAVALCALATPSGNMLAMLAALYNKDSFLLATEGISLTTAVSVVTMPLVAYLVGIG